MVVFVCVRVCVNLLLALLVHADGVCCHRETNWPPAIFALTNYYFKRASQYAREPLRCALCAAQALKQRERENVQYTNYARNTPAHQCTRASDPALRCAKANIAAPNTSTFTTTTVRNCLYAYMYKIRAYSIGACTRPRACAHSMWGQQRAARRCCHCCRRADASISGRALARAMSAR